jgi:simple sugar transport system permease protein
MRAAVLRSLTSLAISVLIAAAAIGVSLIAIWLAHAPPGAALRAMWDGAFGNTGYIEGTVVKMIPLTLVALGWIVAFSALRINVGFEGQILIGGVCAAVIAVEVHGLPRAVELPLGVLCGIAGGAVFAALPAWLWARRHVNEIITTLLLNFVAIQIVSWLVRGPLQEPTHVLPETPPFAAASRWPHVPGQPTLTWDFLYIPLLVIVVAFVLSRTAFGFRLKLTGASEQAARHAGVRTVKISVVALVLSGALAGLAGSSLILANADGVMTDGFSANYGFDGIVTALLARNSPAGVPPAALLFAGLRQGGELLEARLGISSSLVLVTQGIVIVLLAGSTLLVGRRRSRRVEAEEPLESRRGLAEA